jgi:indolepyruvate ferredoxin oxidoreductase
VWGIVVAGIGGTGVITIGQLLGYAAHIEGKGVVTQDAGGLAQKGGATWSHVLIADNQNDIRTTRVGMACADLIIGCDPIVTAGKETLLRMRPGRTHVALNSHSAPTAAFVRDANWHNPGAQCMADIASAVSPSDLGVFDAEAVATQCMGDSIYSNLTLLGFAWQKGWIPLQLDSLLRAIELNATAVARNQQAFAWGRKAALDWPSVQQAMRPAQVIHFTLRTTANATNATTALAALVQHRAAFLTQYQNARYAQRYTALVDKVRAAEQALQALQARAPASGPADGNTNTNTPAPLPLTMAVARYLFKLMAYKDEYEVARLHADPAFLNQIKLRFEGDYTLRYHLAPPLFARKNAQGVPQKIQLGAWMLPVFRLLASLKFLRGTPLDVFGYSAERRQERALVDQYEAAIVSLLPALHPNNLAAALAFAKVPEHIRGFGHVKQRHLATALPQWEQLLAQFAETPTEPLRRSA